MHQLCRVCGPFGGPGQPRTKACTHGECGRPGEEILEGVRQRAIHAFPMRCARADCQAEPEVPGGPAYSRYILHAHFQPGYFYYVAVY